MDAINCRVKAKRDQICLNLTRRSKSHIWWVWMTIMYPSTTTALIIFVII